MKILNDNAKNKGYLMPFEGEEHKATVVMLPYRKDVWGNGGSLARKEFYNMIKAISKYEKVYIIMDPRMDDEVKDEFNIPNTEILYIPYNDAWARDIAPLFVRNKDNKLLGILFGFNAWGGEVDGLYKDYSLDNNFKERLAQELDFDLLDAKDFILEGGSIHTDGNKTLLSTKACLLSKGRNPKLSLEEIENKLSDFLGVTNFIWLDNGIVNDETNEHVDNMACFLDQNTICLAWTDDVNDPQYEYSLNALKVLEKARNIDGLPYNIIKLPVPSPALYFTSSDATKLEPSMDSLSRFDGNRLAASYVNFYLGKDFLILPQFGVKEDDICYDILSKALPNKEIIRINSKEILNGGGNIHCVTMQIPKGEF